jgi:hypothetical protein
MGSFAVLASVSSSQNVAIFYELLVSEDVVVSSVAEIIVARSIAIG